MTSTQTNDCFTRAMIFSLMQLEKASGILFPFVVRLRLLLLASAVHLFVSIKEMYHKCILIKQDGNANKK
jgi:hypothetical protein